jgi:hypothetical protein
VAGDFKAHLTGTIARLLAERRAAADAAPAPAPVAQPEPVNPLELHERDWRYYKAALRGRQAAEAYAPFSRPWRRS